MILTTTSIMQTRYTLSYGKYIYIHNNLFVNASYFIIGGLLNEHHMDTIITI